MSDKADEIRALAGQIGGELTDEKPKRRRRQPEPPAVEDVPDQEHVEPVRPRGKTKWVPDPDAPRQKSEYPQVYNPEGEWCGFFLTEQAARDWIIRVDGHNLPRYTVSYLKPPRYKEVPA